MKTVKLLLLLLVLSVLQGCGTEEDNQIDIHLYHPVTLTDELIRTIQNTRITVDEPDFWRNDSLGGDPISFDTFEFFRSEGSLSGIKGEQFQMMVEMLNPVGDVVARGFSPTLMKNSDSQSIEMIVAPTDSFYYTTNSTREVTSIKGSRAGHTLTTLPNGKILIWGGLTPGGIYTNIQYLYNPLNNRFTQLINEEFQEVPEMRAGHTATLVYLDNAQKLYPRVLITGGYNQTGALSSAELFDPESGTLQTLRSMSFKRGYHTATVMKNGLVMLVGGTDGATFRKEVEFFNPAQKEFLQFTPLPIGISGHQADNIGDNQVIVTGGHNGDGIQKKIYLIDFGGGSISELKELNIGRTHHETVIVNEQLFVIGGFTQRTLNDKDQEQFLDGTPSIERLFLSRLDDPVSVWSSVLVSGRGFFTATKLKNNQIAIIGGVTGSNATTSLKREILDYSATGDPYHSDLADGTTPDSMKQPRYNHKAILTPTAQVLILGGYDMSGVLLGSSECYNMK